MHRCNARTRSAADLAPAEPGEWAGEGYCKRSAGWGTEHKGEGRCKSHGGNATAPTGGAPAGNSNALKTGEHSAIFAAGLTPEEEAVWRGTDPSTLPMLDEQIRYCRIRLRRMQARADDLRGQSLVITEITQEDSVAGEEERGGAKTSEKREAALGVIQSIEDAITRVQGRLRQLLKDRFRVVTSGSDDAEIDVDLSTLSDEQLEQIAAGASPASVV